jgi:mannose-6-phosphate isomerase-like protein (cupin superfamily)
MNTNHTIIRVLDTAGDLPELPIVEGKGAAKVVMWPGNGARFRSFHHITLHEGASTIAQSHPSDCVYYTIQGVGSVTDVKTERSFPVEEGAMLHIDAGDTYRIVADKGASLTVLGGPCPPDEALYNTLKQEGR